MALRSLRKWSIGAVLLVAVGCGGGVSGAADDPVDPSAFTLALCESALERRLAIENDQARFLATGVPLSALQSDDGVLGAEWRRLEAQHEEAERDIAAHCLVPAGVATPTPSPTPTVTPTAPPTLDPRPTAAPLPRRRTLVPIRPTPTGGG